MEEGLLQEDKESLSRLRDLIATPTVTTPQQPKPFVPPVLPPWREGDPCQNCPTKLSKGYTAADRPEGAQKKCTLKKYRGEELVSIVVIGIITGRLGHCIFILLVLIASPPLEFKTLSNCLI